MGKSQHHSQRGGGLVVEGLTRGHRKPQRVTRAEKGKMRKVWHARIGKKKGRLGRSAARPKVFLSIEERETK